MIFKSFDADFQPTLKEEKKEKNPADKF